ncbi:TPA: EAL domain-containing protein [Vibrio vulnificus]|nr:EAL domain-containing protein [Vibrio vulnificus]
MNSLFGHYLRTSLSRRFITFVLAFLISIQFVSYALVQVTVDTHIREEIRETLEVSKRVWDQLLIQASFRLQENADLLASDFGFRTAVATQDQQTITSALQNNAARVDASIAVLIDHQWALQALSEDDISETSRKELVTAIKQFSTARPYHLMIYKGKPTQFVLAPIRAPRIVGYVLFGFEITHQRISLASQLAGVDIALLSSLSDSSNIYVVSNEAQIKAYFSSLAEPRPTASSTMQDRAIADRVFVTETLTEKLPNQHWIYVVFLESLDAASLRFDKLASQYLWVSGLAIVLFTLAVLALSHRVIRPLITLTKATEALAEGNYTATIEGTQRPDEIGQLTRGFDQMRGRLQEQKQTITQLAYFDTLTHLPNREHFRQHLKQELAHPSLKSISVITINLDRFKHINDVLGYHVGDAVLQEMAQRLTLTSESLPLFAARISGDEFVGEIKTGSDELVDCVIKIKQRLDAPFYVNDTPIDISVSIGVATWPSDGGDVDSLLNASQIAMYSAKRKKAQVVFYDSALVTANPENLSLLSELRRALLQNELRVYLQPKVMATTKVVSSAEALIRWKHPERGLLAPFFFVPFAEQTGYVRELTRWMIQQVIQHWRELQPLSGQLTISVNLSTWDLINPQLLDDLQHWLSEYHVPASGLCLEITESAIMEDPETSELTLLQLSQMGFHLSIDDFGTGYSSLGYLQRLPVNELKVDKSFVLNMLENPNDKVIVSSTIHLAHSLGLQVVAEGVESYDLFTSLRELGCDEIQGYCVSKPIALEEFIAWREEWMQSNPYTVESMQKKG